MSEYTVTKAREYENKHAGDVSADERPAFHVTGQIGWINDPNGFSVYKDEYHLFFQYHPYTTFWGPMHWGHVKTRDFIKWENLPVAIAPDEKYDSKGCFSGSAVELEDGRQLLIYTGVSETEKDGKIFDIQQQCIAYGDGVDYIKSDKNPVIPSELIPNGFSIVDFRDPKIWRENGKYYLVLGNRTEDGSGAILLYESEDASNWRFTEIIDRCDNRYGRMWECPDFFKLDDKEVLLVSPQDMEAEDLEFHTGNGTVVLIGHHGDKDSFVRESARSIDYGLDFYAPQTLVTEDGRRVMIAWMQNWDTCNQNHEGRNIYGQMTIPRELRIEDGRLCQVPVRELNNYRGTEHAHEIKEDGRDISFENVCGRCFDMEIELEIKEESKESEFVITLAKSDKCRTTLSVDLKKRIMTFDRSKSGGRRDIVSARSCKIQVKNNKVSLRVIMDHNGVEAFVNNGEQVMSSIIYTPADAKSILFDSVNTKADIRFCKINI